MAEEEIFVGIDVSKAELVAAGLWMAGIAVAAVNPSWVRNFAKGRGVRAKTDRKDAELLALFAEREQPEARPPADAETQALQAPVMRREQLLEMLVAEKQRLTRAAGSMRKELRHHIAYLEGRIKEAEADIDKTVRRSDGRRRKSEIVRSVPGFGKAFCSMVLGGSAVRTTHSSGYIQRRLHRWPSRRIVR